MDLWCPGNPFLQTHLPFEPFEQRFRGELRTCFVLTSRYRIILPAAKEWSIGIDFIRWSDRLDYDNHHPFFPALFTTIWDTTCIRISEPGDWGVARYTCNGHYDFPCYLVLLGMIFTGALVFYSGLHRSTAYDSHIFKDTAHLHPQHPHEMNRRCPLPKLQEFCYSTCQTPWWLSQWSRFHFHTGPTARPVQNWDAEHRVQAAWDVQERSGFQRARL